MFRGHGVMPEPASRQVGPKTRTCWIQLLGSKTLRQCNLFDVSSRGAIISSPGALPDTFDLFLALNTDVGRRCRVVARSGHEVDVEFLDADAS